MTTLQIHSVQAVKLVSLLVIAIVLTGCAGSLDGDSGSGSSLASLHLSTNTYVLPALQTLTIIPQGGTQPYRYAITSGSCTVGANTGLVTAGSSAEICSIGVTDAAGASVVATITVTGGATGSGSTTKTYAWSAGAFGACLSGSSVVTCGGGTQTRTVTCLDNLGATVGSALCTMTAPATSQSCNVSACVRPAGSYQLTCTNVSITGTTLTETCGTIAGGAMTTTTLSDWASCQPNSISNSDGQLVCTR